MADQHPDVGGVDLGALVSAWPNEDLLSGLDVVLLELERRLLHYAERGGELLDMADEGLILATRAAARLRQAQSAAAHAAGHLQVLGVGEWSPSSTNPGWSDDPRVFREHEPGGAEED